MTKKINGIYYMLLKYLNGSVSCLISRMQHVLWEAQFMKKIYRPKQRLFFKYLHVIEGWGALHKKSKIQCVPCVESLLMIQSRFNSPCWWYQRGYPLDPWWFTIEIRFVKLHRHTKYFKTQFKNTSHVRWLLMHDAEGYCCLLEVVVHYNLDWKVSSYCGVQDDTIEIPRSS